MISKKLRARGSALFMIIILGSLALQIYSWIKGY